MKITLRPQTVFGLPARRPPGAGFTLLELLTVMTLIAILAAIGVGGMRFAANKAASSRTEALLKTIELALEKYQLKYGEYPDFEGTGSPKLNGFDSAGAWLLYEVMTGDGDEASEGGTSSSNGDIDASETPLIEGIFTGNSDKFNNVEQDDAGNFVVVDGWGNPLQYHRADESGYDERNGTYDLWSYGTAEDGLGTPEAKWITNW